MPDTKEDSKDKKVRIKVVEEVPSDEENENEVKKDIKAETSEDTEENDKEKRDEETLKDKPGVEPIEKDEETNTNNPDKIPLWVLIFAFLVGLTIGAGLIGGIFFYKSRVQQNPSEIIKVSPSPVSDIDTASSTPNPTPLDVDKSKYTLQVLNGTGIVGDAGKIKALLENSGFNNVATSNASSYLNEETEISYKEDIPKELLDEIKSILSEYKTEDGEILEDTDKYDVIVLSGSLRK